LGAGKLGMANLADWRQVLTLVRAHRAQLRFCLRVTAAGLLAFAIAQVLTIPLHGLWVVLTAVVVTQMSAGGSLRATVEYILGTFGGAVYAAITGVLIPHTTPIAQGGVLALTIAPLALAAALNPNFRVAPFSAVLVLLISGQLSEGFEVLLERASRKRPFTCEGSPWSPARYAAEAQNSRIEQSDARLSIIRFRIGRTLDQ
jgi:uncharacterized membrane protein YccC